MDKGRRLVSKSYGHGRIIVIWSALFCFLQVWRRELAPTATDSGRGFTIRQVSSSLFQRGIEARSAKLACRARKAAAAAKAADTAEEDSKPKKKRRGRSGAVLRSESEHENVALAAAHVVPASLQGKAAPKPSDAERTADGGAAPGLQGQGEKRDVCFRRSARRVAQVLGRRSGTSLAGILQQVARTYAQGRPLVPGCCWPRFGSRAMEEPRPDSAFSGFEASSESESSLQGSGFVISASANGTFAQVSAFVYSLTRFRPSWHAMPAMPHAEVLTNHHVIRDSIHQHDRYSSQLAKGLYKQPEA